jgi:uncharacterized protein (UPF0332 family)
MVFQWGEFGKIAQNLYQFGQRDSKLCEAAYRCAISRSYYAAFHHLRIIGEIERRRPFSKTGTAHSEVIDYFSKHADRQKQVAGNNLLQLKRNRRKSDYVESTKISDGTAQFSIALSNQIYQNIR